MRLALVTDAWHPQVNGVVTTLSATRACLEAAGYEVVVASPEGRPAIEKIPAGPRGEEAGAGERSAG